jgi:hypothetical protein
MMKTVLLDVKSTNTIVQIKSKIGALEGIGKSQQALFCWNYGSSQVSDFYEFGE